MGGGRAGRGGGGGGRGGERRGGRGRGHYHYALGGAPRPTPHPSPVQEAQVHFKEHPAKRKHEPTWTFHLVIHTCKREGGSCALPNPLLSS